MEVEVQPGIRADAESSIGILQDLQDSKLLEEITLPNDIVEKYPEVQTDLNNLISNLKERRTECRLSFGNVLSICIMRGIESDLLSQVEKICEMNAIVIPPGVYEENGLVKILPEQTSVDRVERNKSLIDSLHEITINDERVILYRSISGDVYDKTQLQLAPGLRNSDFSLSQLLLTPRVVMNSGYESNALLNTVFTTNAEELSLIHKFGQTRGQSPFISSSHSEQFPKDWNKGGQLLKLSVPKSLTLSEDQFTYNAPADLEDFKQLVEYKALAENGKETERGVSYSTLHRRALQNLHSLDTSEDEVYILGGIHPDWVIEVIDY